MGKNKLRKFAEMQEFACVLQYPFARLRDEGFPHRGRWASAVFGNERPVVLELGCGRGEYTVGLARRFPGVNFVGIDVKGARIYAGAKQVEQEGISNAAFLRASIEDLGSFFAPGEVAGIWITFPDPQMKHARRRLTASRFLNMYAPLLSKDGTVRLKTDSPFLHAFTRRLIERNALPLLASCPDLYGAVPTGLPPYLTEIQTAYERQWLSRGKQIRYLEFALPAGLAVADPEEDDIERDDYRAIPRPDRQPQPLNVNDHLS